LNPNWATAGLPVLTLTVNGSGFLSGATVQWNGSALATSYVNGNQLTAAVSAGEIAAPGSASVTVVNPGGSGSNAATFTTAPLLAPGWTDDFDSYALGSFPSTWINSGNNAVSVVNTFDVSPPQSLQMYGIVGGCWGAVASRQLALSPPFTVRVSVRNNNEALSGCDPYRGVVSLLTGPSWTYPGVELWGFDQTGNLYTTVFGGQELASLPLLQWNTVAIAYEFIDTSTVSTTYWINGQPGIVVTRPAASQEASMTWLALAGVEGTAWFDNVEVSAAYTISGQVTLSGSGLSGVTVTLSGSQSVTTTTDGSGNYGFNLPAGGNYTVTPSLNGYTFSPPSSTFNNLSSNQTADFAGTAAVSAPILVLQDQQSNAVSVWLMGGPNGTVIEQSPIIATASPNWSVVGTADFNNDGVPDILLQNQATNQISVWYMGGTNGLTIVSSPIVGQPSPGWEVAGLGDFNRDGYVDLLLQNSSTNALSIWYLGPNFTVLYTSAVATPLANWHVVGVADFNGDGSPDLLLQNQVTNQVSISYMSGPDGTTVLSSPIIAAALAGWKVVGTSDFSNEAVPDIVLQNQSTNQVSVWYMGGPQGATITSSPIIAMADPGWSILGSNNTQPPPTRQPRLFLQNQQSNAVSKWEMGGASGTVIEESPVIATAAANWRVVASADFNNDGVPDILLQDQVSNQISVWYMGGTDGLTITTSPIVGQPATDWEVVGTADFNHDGTADLLLQNTSTNALSIWYLGPNFTVLSAPVVATPAANWHVVGVADFNGDGSPDLLLQNLVTNEVSIWYLTGSQGTTILSAPIIATSDADWKVVGASDFNDDGVPDIVLQNQVTNQVSVWYMGPAQGNPPQGQTYTSAPIIQTAAPGWSVVAVR
jgi:hypothetical protein